MKYIKKTEGFTLIEIIIAMFIFMVILIAFTSLFTTSISGIFGAGDKSAALFKGQEMMDNIIEEGPTSGEETHSIVFPGIAEPIVVTGEEKEVEYDYEDRTIVLYYFLPAGN